MADITQRKLVAANHRVVDINIMRYSAVFGLLPKYKTAVPMKLLKKEKSQKRVDASTQADSDTDESSESDEGAVIFGDYIVKKEMSNAERAGFALPDRSKRYRTETGEIIDPNR